MATTRGCIAIFVLGACACGCGGVMIEPGHRGLLFDPATGLQREVLAPGYHAVRSGRIDDFDVTYTQSAEPLHVITKEGLSLDVMLSIIYRPIIAELYALDAEIGPSYYKEIVGPEFRAAARACFARHSYVDLLGRNEGMEDEIEVDVRRRIAGKHVEITSVTMESVALAPEIVSAVRDRILAAEIAQKKKIEVESAAAQEKADAERAWEREKIELEHNVERRRLEREAAGSH